MVLRRIKDAFRGSMGGESIDTDYLEIDLEQEEKIHSVHIEEAIGYY